MAALYYASPRWTNEVADCSMPMTFDSYSRCAFQCLYCFAAYQRGIGVAKAAYLSHQVKPVNVERIKRIFLEPDCFQFGEYVKRRMVMQWGGMSDPFCWYERKYGVGLELLRFFKEIDYPLCFSTKGTWWLDDERYTSLFRGQSNWNVKVSIITRDEAKAGVIEKGVTSPDDRLGAIEKISKLGCGGATLRLRPFMIGISNPSHIALIREAGKRGASAVSTEFFCLEQRSPVLKGYLKTISECAGFDYLAMYKKYSYSRGYLRLNRNVKRGFVDEMEAACAEVRMRFYVSDAHFKERCANGSCCGLPADWNYSKGQFCEALLLCKRNGRVTWGEIADNLDHLKGFQWDRAEGFNSNSSEKRARFMGLTMYDYMRWLWNHPKAGQSPYTMFEGVMKPIEVDADQNIIYEYDEARA